jgi:hypothetical protein
MIDATVSGVRAPKNTIVRACELSVVCPFLVIRIAGRLNGRHAGRESADQNTTEEQTAWQERSDRCVG